MAKQSATAQNAVTHGIFRQDLPSAPPSPFAVLAHQSLPGPRGEDMADDLMRAERQTARCRASILDQAQAIEPLLAAALLQAEEGQAHQIDMAIDAALETALIQLTRLLRYQNQSLTALRKARIAILNAAEGFGALNDKGRG